MAKSKRRTIAPANTTKPDPAVAPRPHNITIYFAFLTAFITLIGFGLVLLQWWMNKQDNIRPYVRKELQFLNTPDNPGDSLTLNALFKNTGKGTALAVELGGCIAYDQDGDCTLTYTPARDFWGVGETFAFSFIGGQRPHDDASPRPCFFPTAFQYQFRYYDMLRHPLNSDRYKVIIPKQLLAGLCIGPAPPKGLPRHLPEQEFLKLFTPPKSFK